MSLSNVDVVLWVQMGVFWSLTAILLFMGWGCRTLAKRLKMLAFGFAFVVMAISSTSMALEQGYKTRIDLVVVNWERYTALSLFLPFFVFAVGLSLDDWWGKATTAFALEFIASVLLIFGEISTGQPVWVSFIYSSAAVVVVILFMSIFFIVPEGANVTSQWRWITIGITSLGLVVYQILYLLSEGWLAVFTADNPVGAAMYLVVNACMGIWGLIVFRMIDLQEDVGGIGVGLPVVVGNGKNCKNDVNNSSYAQFSNGAAAAPAAQRGIGSKLEL